MKNIYDSLISKYEEAVENENLWLRVKSELLNQEDISKISDMEKFVEDFDIIIEKKVLEEKGYSFIQDGKICICIDFTNSEKVNRFTIAHELAHILFDFKKLESGYKIKSDYIESELYHDPSEIRANQFAADLLMPKIIIEEQIFKLFKIKQRQHDDQGKTIHVSLTTEEVIPELVSLLNVSYTAVENRLKNLGMVK